MCSILTHAKHTVGKQRSDYPAPAREALVCQQQLQFLSSLYAFKIKILFLQAHLGFQATKLTPKEV